MLTGFCSPAASLRLRGIDRKYVTVSATEKEGYLRAVMRHFKSNPGPLSADMERFHRSDALHREDACTQNEAMLRSKLAWVPFLAACGWVAFNKPETSRWRGARSCRKRWFPMQANPRPPVAVVARKEDG